MNTYTTSTVTELGQGTIEQDACFDSTGFMTSRRTRKSLLANSSASPNDLLVLFSKDGNGNISSERYWGGDDPVTSAASSFVAAPTTFTCGQPLTDEAYRIDHTYASGVHKTATYVDAGGIALSFRNTDNVVDAFGLVSTSVERAVVGSSGGAADGLSTRYSYDALGRLTDIEPLVTSTNLARGAAMHYAYTMSPPSLTTTTVDNGTTIATTTIEFDGLGRPRYESTSLPGGGTKTRETRYDGAGRTVAISEEEGMPQPQHFSTLSYDALDRVISTTRPDGAQEIRSYVGVSSMTRGAQIRTGGNATTFTNSFASTTEYYDRQGRLVRVVEPNGVGTSYGYDTANHLTSVCMKDANAACGQQRLFTYDGRGFLTSEQHPEYSSNGNGSVSYKYDARGHVIRRTQGTEKFDLAYQFDRAERLKKVAEAGSGRPQKLFFFGTTNTATDYANGQVVKSIRYNWMLPKIPDSPDPNNAPFAVQAVEQFTYGARDAKISSKKTYVLSCVVHAAGDCEAADVGTKINEFTQTFGYDAFGATSQLGYPGCAVGCGPTALPGRSVTNTRSNGLLTSIAWDTSTATLAYSQSGMLSTVTHPNLIKDEMKYSGVIPSRLESISSSATDSDNCVVPTFSQQPASSTVISGNPIPVVLTAAASGQSGQTVTYQWSSYSGSAWATIGTPSTTASLTINPPPAQTTSYKVTAANSCGSRDSDVVTVTVCTVPSVASVSANRTITRGQTIALSIAASGSAPFQYQWYTRVGGALQMIPGATSSTISVAPLSTTSYVAAVVNGCGTATSQDVTITVAAPPTTPTGLAVNRNSAGTVTMTWNASSAPSGAGIDHYEIVRVNDGATVYSGMPTSLQYTDSSVAQGKAYAYRVRAFDGNGIAGSYSRLDITVTIAFQDDPVIGAAGPGPATPVRGAHVGQLRQAIDAVRSLAGLGAMSWSYAAPNGPAYADDILLMRAAIDQARAQLAIPAAVYTTTVGANVAIRAVDINDLRKAVK